MNLSTIKFEISFKDLLLHEVKSDKSDEDIRDKIKTIRTIEREDQSFSHNVCGKCTQHLFN